MKGQGLIVEVYERVKKSVIKGLTDAYLGSE